MENPEALYIVLKRWIGSCWLSAYELKYDERIYTEALCEFISDYARWYPDDEKIDLLRLEMTPQLHAVLTYRLAHRWWKTDEKQALLLSNLGRVNGQCEIFYSATIGSGLKINHGLGTVIGARCTIGDNCTIHQGVTLGDRHGKRPVIGNDCFLYAHSMVLGEVTLGDRCIVAANAVVTRSAPEDSILVGTPAVITQKKNL